MRTSIDIILDPSLKGLECKFPTLPSVPPNTIVQLTQNNNSIYTIYQPSSQTTKAQLPAKLCQLNNILAGAVHIQPMMGVQQCRRLSVYVSRLDWQIISNRASRLEEQFMNQISVVWPNAMLPLFYDRSNSVSLRVVCDGLGYLVEHSQLQILVEDSSVGNNSKQKQQKEQQKEQSYEGECVVMPGYAADNGNINKIYVLRDHEMFASWRIKAEQKGSKNNSKSKSNKQKQNQNQRQGEYDKRAVNGAQKNLMGINDRNNINSKLTQSTSYNSTVSNEKKSNTQGNNNIGVGHQKQPQSQQQQQARVPQQLQAYLDRYQFKLQYRPVEAAKHTVPCDTHILTVKDQITIIKQAQSQTPGSATINPNANANDKQKIDKDKQRGMLDILVQVQVIEHQQLAQIQAHHYQLTGLLFTTHSYTHADGHGDDDIAQQQIIQQSQHDQQQSKQQYHRHRRTTMYISELAVRHWGIDTTCPLTLRKTPSSSGERASKKLEYLLNASNTCISVYVSHPKQSALEVIKQSFVAGWVTQLTTPQEHHPEKGQEQMRELNDMGKTSDTSIKHTNHTLTVYSKIPYVFNIINTDTHTDNTQKSPSSTGKVCAFVHIQQNGAIVGDPLTLIYSAANTTQLPKGRGIPQPPHTSHAFKQEELDKQSKGVIKQHQRNGRQDCAKETIINDLKAKLGKIVKVINYFYMDQGEADTKTKVQVLNKISNLLAKQNKSGINYITTTSDGLVQRKRSSKRQEEIFIQLYQICYREEITKIMQLIAGYGSCLSRPQEGHGVIRQQQQEQQQGETLRYETPRPREQAVPPLLLPILVTSFSNNGKTVMNSILRRNKYQTLYLDLAQFDDTSHHLADLSTYLELAFQLYQGDLIFMDNLDSVCYQIDHGDQHRRQERIASKLLLRKITTLAKTYCKICVFTAKNDTNIDEELSNYQLIKLKNPTRETRELIAKEYYYKITNQEQRHQEYGTKKIQEAMSQNKQNIQNKNRNEQKDTEIKQKIEQIISNSESMSFGQYSKYVISGHRQEGTQKKGQSIQNFSKLAGIKQAKSSIRSIIEKPLKYNFVFKKLPIKLSRGILLYGGSGTGKTAIGQALAGQFMMKFFSIKGSDILSKYIGGSEAAVRDIFEKAMSVSPSIIFFDQFQSIVPRRNSSNTGVTDRVVNQFLCYLDGVASVEGVYIMAASSRPQLIDPALLRPGRIDTHIYLDYPKEQQREQLFSLYNNSIKFQTPSSQLLKLTDGYSYSDLIGLIKQLRIKQSARIIKRNSSSLLAQSDTAIDVNQFKFIDDGFLREIIQQYKISVGRDDQKKQREKYLAFKRGDAVDISKQKTMLQ